MVEHPRPKAETTNNELVGSSGGVFYSYFIKRAWIRNVGWYLPANEYSEANPRQDEDTGEGTVQLQAVEGIMGVDGQRCEQMDEPDGSKIECHGEPGVIFWF